MADADGGAPRGRIRLCGSLAVELEGRRLETALPGRQGRALLAYLVLNRARPVTRDELLDILWPTDPPRDPDAALRVVLSKLRSALTGAALEGRSELRLVLPEDVQVDLETAEQALADAYDALARGDAARARDRAKLALLVAEQPFLPGVEAPWVEARRRAVGELRLGALEALAESALAVGDEAGRATAVRAAAKLVEDEPFRESGHQLLMRALAGGGNVAEALRVYDDLRVRLREELGTTPAPGLQQLHVHLLEIGEEHPAGAPVARAPLPLPPRLSIQGAAPFVGRAADLEALARALDDTRSGGLRLAFVSGEPGIGKSRLCAEFAAAARGSGATVLYGRSYEEPLRPYQPFVEALGDYVAASPPEALRERVGPIVRDLPLLLGAVAVAFAEPQAPAPSDPESDRYRLVEAGAALLRAVASEGPALLVLDDLHWADEGSLLMLKHVVRTCTAVALLVLGTYRDSELHAAPQLRETLAQLRREQAPVHRTLAGLVEQDVAKLVRAGLGEVAQHRLAPAVARRTDGNPFFVEEVLRDVAETGAEDLSVPEGVKQVIAHRVARLGDRTARMLEVAAVAGQEFEFDVLDRVAGLGAVDLAAALDEAAAAQLIHDVPGPFGAYGFSHALVRETLYDTLPPAQRALVHRRIAEALETIYEPLFSETT